MDESFKSEARLEVSVSFGRFENAALSWEKFSSFSPNKYLEEVGTLSNPGSVAQKKAYFEAHYKKIAAKKAEDQLEQEKSINSVLSTNPSSNVSSKGDHVEDSSEVDSKFHSSNGERLSEEIEQEACISSLENETFCDETKDDNAILSKGLEEEAFTNGLIDVIPFEEVKEEVNDELNDTSVDPEINVNEESVLVRVEIPNKDTRDFLGKPRERKNGVEQLKKENSKLNARNIAQKVTPIKKDIRNLATTKKVISPSAKSLQVSTPISASRSLNKKVNVSPLPKSKNLLSGQSKKTGPTSLHVSLTLGPTTPVANMSTTRKSSIMEQMGDKDIVKRAFKSFQNRTMGSYSDEKPNIGKIVASTAIEPKNSSFRTPVRGTQGLRKDAQKIATPKSLSGTRSTIFPSSGSHKSSTRDRKDISAVSPAIGLKSDEKTEKRKEFLKTLEAKSIAREAKNAQLNAKSKDEKKTEIKKLSQSYNSIAKPKSSFYQGRKKIV